MSYDTRLWTTKRVDIASKVSSQNNWKKNGNCFCYEAKEWRIVVASCQRVLSEDVTEEALEINKKIRYLIEITIEPMSAPKDPHIIIEQLVKECLQDNDGVFEDQQKGFYGKNFLKETSGHDGFLRGVRESLRSWLKALLTPSSNKSKKKQEERFSLLHLTWYFKDGPLTQEDGIVKLIDILKKYLPEALPKRYGLYEPPQYSLQQEGDAHLIEFFKKNIKDFIVCYPHKPVWSLHFDCYREFGLQKRGERQEYLVRYLEIAIDAQMLYEVAWRKKIMTAWKELTFFIQPFYAEARTLGGFCRERSTYSSDINTEVHPTGGGYWYGIPEKMGVAAVVGEPYIKLWPEIQKQGEASNGYVFLSLEDWRSKKDLTDLIGPVPREIVQKGKTGWIKGLKGEFSLQLKMDLPDKFPY